MPNWVYNSLTIQGPKEQVDFIKDKLNTSYTRHYEDYWDSGTGTTIAKDIVFSNPVFSFWNIIVPTDLSAYVRQTDNTLSIEDRLKFETNDWYSWNVRNWGTKWDVAVQDDEKYTETELVEHMSNDEDQWLVYRFNTAWSPPFPAIEKLSALVPNCVVTLEYEEEQGWGGESEFVNGKQNYDNDYESKCVECDKYDTLEFCEDCENNVCSFCGYGREDECQTHMIESELPPKVAVKENA